EIKCVDKKDKKECRRRKDKNIEMNKDQWVRPASLRDNLHRQADKCLENPNNHRKNLTNPARLISRLVIGLFRHNQDLKDSPLLMVDNSSHLNLCRKFSNSRKER
ncbi:MAG: hypothetical protein AAB941_01015, partial [Patescibacteria group bacterium]